VPSVQHVVVLRTWATPCPPMTAGRDHDWAAAVARQPAELATAEMAADDPAVLLYTSGTTGKPKGCVWTHVSFLGSMVTRDMHICADFKASDRFFFMSDMGWMVGAMCACIPSYFGGSLLVAEGTPDFPDTGRFWRLVQDHRSPTWAWRRRWSAMMRYGDGRGRGPRPVGAARHHLRRRSLDRSALALVLRARVQEAPAHPQHRRRHRGRRLQLHRHRASIRCGRAASAAGLGVAHDIVDDAGRPVRRGQVGELVLRNPNIGLTKSLWRDDERYLDSYWRTCRASVVHGDFAMAMPTACSTSWAAATTP
jgi:acetyl-CoA synthetase